MITSILLPLFQPLLLLLLHLHLLLLILLPNPSFGQELDRLTFDFQSGLQLNCSSDIDSQRLNQKCHLLKLFNQTEVDLMEQQEARELAIECACQLSYMHLLWEANFDKAYTRRLAAMVRQASKRENVMVSLWNDVDVIVKGISIHTATKDYLQKKATNPELRPSRRLQQELDKMVTWRTIGTVCRLVSDDERKLYRYLENLVRLDPVVFVALIVYDDVIDDIYQASKACKMPLMLHLDKYQIRPTNVHIIRVDDDLDDEEDYNKVATNDKNKQQQPVSGDWAKAITYSEDSVTNDIDLVLKDASLDLLQCHQNQEQTQPTLQQISQLCPMMTGDKVVTSWLKEHPSAPDRSDVAIECGCKLLSFNSTWPQILDDQNVKILSKSLTNYMNQNTRLPNFKNTPVWALNGWFNDMMLRFERNRKMSVKEIIKTKANSQDITSPVNDKTDNFNTALELLRRACLLVMFNRRKGTKQSVGLRLIHYLDNLQLISRDPMFVFHLTLQDPNLFKLYALSKMCKPVIH